MKFIQAFLIARGRITRSTYFFRMLLLSLGCLGLGTMVGGILGEEATAVFSAIFVYSALTLSCQRIHDIGRSGWTLLALIIPVLGPLWISIQLMRLGTVDSNRYGKAPGVCAGYLAVDTGK